MHIYRHAYIYITHSHCIYWHTCSIVNCTYIIYPYIPILCAFFCQLFSQIQGCKNFQEWALPLLHACSTSLILSHAWCAIWVQNMCLVRSRSICLTNRSKRRCNAASVLELWAGRSLVSRSLTYAWYGEVNHKRPQAAPFGHAPWLSDAEIGFRLSQCRIFHEADNEYSQ